MVKRYSLRIMLLVSVMLLFGITRSAWAEISPEVSSLSLTPEQWVGQSFLFLDLPTDKQAEGYEIFSVAQAIQGFQGDRSVRIPYAAHVGKRVTVTDVISYTAGYDQKEYIIYLQEKGTDNQLVGRTMRGQLEGLVLEADLLKARQQFIDKTIYAKRRTLQGLYDPHTGLMPMAVPVKIGDALQVIDVYAGIQSREPIWLIVSVHGEKAIMPIAYSCTNLPVNAWTQNPPWQDELFVENPRDSLGWSEALWEQIEAGIVQTGMTKDQVRLSWGAPVFFDQNIWHYGTKILKFSGDKLISMETVDLSNVIAP